MLVKILIVVVLSFSLCENTLLGGHNQVDLNDEAVLEHMTRLALFGLKTISEKRAQMLNTNPDEPKKEVLIQIFALFKCINTLLQVNLKVEIFVVKNNVSAKSISVWNELLFNN